MANIGELLVEEGLPRERLDECRKQAATSGDTLDRVIVSKGYLPETSVLRVYSQALGMEYLDELVY